MATKKTPPHRYVVKCADMVRGDFGEPDRYAALGFAERVARITNRQAQVEDMKQNVVWYVAPDGTVSTENPL